MNWYIEVLRKYVDFKGRARRKEYWMFALVNTIVCGILVLIDNALGLVADDDPTLGIFSGIYLLCVFLPTLAVTVRRLHDTDRSGWWFLVSLIPLFGPIVLLVFAVSDSTPGDNEYGPNPKGI